MIRENVGSYTISVSAGTSLEIEVPLDLKIGTGCFPLIRETMKINGVDCPLVLGFAVEKAEVGEITPAPESETEKKLMVIYRHKKSEENRIYFFASTGHRQIINIMAVPIHDHSTIIQGGPALGTYYYAPDTTQTP